MSKNDLLRENYESEKRKITKKVNLVIDAEVSTMLESVTEENKVFLQSLWQLRKKRAERNGRLRDMSVRLGLGMYGVSEVRDEHELVIAAGEFYNMASYFQNWHLDDKKEVRGGKEAKLCHIASHLYREKAHDLILRSTFPEKTKLHLLQELSESNSAVQIGQALEINGSRIIDVQGKSCEEVMAVYTNRCYGMSGRFYGASFAMAPIMADASQEQITLCKSIGAHFGIGLQIINDVGDFCLTPSLVQLSEKDYQDQFSDLMKGTLTLPTYEVSNYVDLDAYVGRELSDLEKQGLLEVIVEKKCFHSSRKESNKRKNEMFRMIKGVPRNEYTKLFQGQIGRLFQSNKFYVNLRENHNYVWGV